MSALSQIRMLDFDDLYWPLTFRFVCGGARGYTSWEMTVDAPQLNGKHDESLDFGTALWSASIATAITRSINLLYYDYVIWKEAPGPSIGSGGGVKGRRIGTPAPRDKSGVLTFNTGHDDRWGRRRHYLYGMPFEWQDANGLTEKGWDGLMGYGHMLSMALSAGEAGGGLQLLNTYWGVIPPTVGNFWGVGFRRVTSYNVFQHTDKAPDLSEQLWPPRSS